jgi:hypothetical protein
MMTDADQESAMGKGFKTVRNDDEKEKHKSPNPQDKKKARTKAAEGKAREEEEEMNDKQEVEEPTVENPVDGKNNKITPEKQKDATSKAEVEKKKKYAGGKQIWNNLIGAPKNTFELTGRKMTNVHAYVPVDIFNESGESVHDLSLRGKSIRKNMTILSAAEWKNLFKEVCESESDLALSTKGKKFRIFGVRLAKTNPKELFEDFMWDGNCLIE